MPSPSGNGVRIRLTRSHIHPGDLQLVEAKYLRFAPAITAGPVPGLEAVGMIEDAAPHALDGTGMTIGSRVAFSASGAWQRLPVVPAGSLVAVPDDLTDDLATQLLINTITARHVLRTALRALSVMPRRIVQTGATSAIGKPITVIAMKNGFSPIRLVRSLGSAERLVGCRQTKCKDPGT